MNSTLYLDTARMGRMCLAARTADREFARMAGKEGCSLYYEQFLKHGFRLVCPRFQERYPNLTFWPGLEGLRCNLRPRLSLPDESPIWFSGRSVPLVHLSMRALCQKADHVLTTDLEWPVYVDVLRKEAARSRTSLTVLNLRHLIFRQRSRTSEFVEFIRNQYVDAQCNGLFLSAVNYQGVRLPVEHILNSLSGPHWPKFVVLDGAQALGHVPLAKILRRCDVLLGGCHKWLRGYYPLSLAIGCREHSWKYLRELYRDMLVRGDLDDPLLRLVDQCGHPSTTFNASGDEASERHFGETANVGPLMTGAAVLSKMRLHSELEQQLAVQQDMAQQIAEASWYHTWRPRQPELSLRSGILLLQAKSRSLRQTSADRLRDICQHAGLVVTAYRHGIIRLSLPASPLHRKSMQRTIRTLRAIAA